MNEEEIIKKINKNEEDRILFRVRNGCGKLRQCSLKDERKIILLDNIPLVTLSEENSPMSSSVIKLIEGRSGVGKNIKEVININIPMKNLEDDFGKLKPFLKLLEDGEYELSKEDMIPTDGENNYFWDSAARTNYYHASADIYYNGKHIKGVPKFLMPSEGIECFDEERVNYYREKIRNGEELLGVALELRGFMALLLDGHHKATAAYLEGKNLKCLTIRCKKHNTEIFDIDDYELKRYEANKTVSKIKIGYPKEVFPHFKAVGVIKKNVDASDNRIEKLLRFQSNHPIEDLEQILYYLTIYDKRRAKEVCFNVLKKREFEILWSECLSYLSLYKDYDTKCFFKAIKEDNEIKFSKNSEKNIRIINKFFNTYIN